ncbi:MAG: hypothetical protein U0794_21730 [Isosphaeraceae bacterium]
MATRVAFWLAGFGVGLILALLTPETLFPGARLTILGLTFLTLGCAGEIRSLLAVSRQVETPPQTARRSPDGETRVVRLGSAARDPNPYDTRYGRFVARQDQGRHEPLRTRPPREDDPRLLGACCLVSIFVGHDGRPWSDEEIARAHQAMERAGRWLEGEAARWDVALNVELLETYFVAQDDAIDEVEVAFAAEGDEVGPLEARAIEKAFGVATRAALACGFRDAADLVEWVETSVDADVVVCLLHPRRNGRSLAVPRSETLLNGVGLALCYCREASFPEPLQGEARTDPVTVVHELLHLFGATDKYGQALRSFAPGSVTSRDVMRLNEERLSRLRVDALTAFEVGWNSNPPDPKKTTAPRHRSSGRSSRFRQTDMGG